MKVNVKNIMKGVDTTQSRFISRAIRTSIGLKKRLNSKKLLSYVFKSVPDCCNIKKVMVESLIEIAKYDVYIYILIQKINIDLNQVQSSKDFKDYPEVIYYYCDFILAMQFQYKLYSQAISFSEAIIEDAKVYNRHSLDFILGKIYWYFVQANVRCNIYTEIRSY